MPAKTSMYSRSLSTRSVNGLDFLLCFGFSDGEGWLTPSTAGFGLGGVKSPPAVPLIDGESDTALSRWREGEERLGLLESK